MPYEFRITRQVQFADTDMAGIMHFSNFFLYMESAEHAFYRSLGFGVHARLDDTVISWPRGGAACEYFAPVRFEDQLEVHLLVKQKKSKSLVYAFGFRKLGSESVAPVAIGSMTSVCCAMDEVNRTMKAVAIPGPFAAKIDVAPPELIKTLTQKR